MRLHGIKGRGIVYEKRSCIRGVAIQVLCYDVIFYKATVLTLFVNMISSHYCVIMMAKLENLLVFL